MSDKKSKMSELEIAGKIKAGKSFSVPSKRERNMAYACAKYLGVEIATRFSSRKPGAQYAIFFLNGGPK